MKIEEFEEVVKTHTFSMTDFEIVTALVGELGELANVIKKADFYNKMPLYKARIDAELSEGKRPPFRTQFIDEAGDTLFYFLKLLNYWGVSLEEIIEFQTNKLGTQSKKLDKTFKK